MDNYPPYFHDLAVDPDSFNQLVRPFLFFFFVSSLSPVFAAWHRFASSPCTGSFAVATTHALRHGSASHGP